MKLYDTKNAAVSALICHECGDFHDRVVNMTDTYRNLCKECLGKAIKLLRKEKENMNHGT